MAEWRGGPEDDVFTVVSGMGSVLVDGGGGVDTLIVDWSDKTVPIWWNSDSGRGWPTLLVAEDGDEVRYADYTFEVGFRPIEHLVVYAGSANDVIWGAGALTTTLYGGAGDDELMGTEEASFLYGGEGNDILRSAVTTSFVMDFADDTLAGGAGDDFLELAGGVDTLVYDLSESSGVRVISFDPILAQLQADGQVTQAELSTAYAAFRKSVRDEDIISWGGETEVTVQTGKKAHERTILTEVTVASDGGSVSSGDGHDTVANFEWGKDKLDFSSLGRAMTYEEFSAAFSAAALDANGDFTNDLRLSLDGGDFSITFLNSGHLGLTDIYAAIDWGF